MELCLLVYFHRPGTKNMHEKASSAGPKVVALSIFISPSGVLSRQVLKTLVERMEIEKRTVLERGAIQRR
jgi:hypothetical protein